VKEYQEALQKKNGSPMEIVDMSEEQLNRPLWVKFKFQNEGRIRGVNGTITGTIVLIPQPRQLRATYLTKLGLVGTSSIELGELGLPGASSVILGGIL
jgi:hypothetical protein